MATISFHDRIVNDIRAAPISSSLSFSRSRERTRLAVSDRQSSCAVWQTSTWFSRGDSRRVLSRLRPFKPPLEPLDFSRKESVSWFPTPLRRPFCLPSTLFVHRRSLTRSLYLFFSSFFFFIQLFPHSTVPVGSFPLLARCAWPVASLSSGMRESRGGGVQARVCVGTHHGMRDSVAMELPARLTPATLLPPLESWRTLRDVVYVGNFS